MSFHEFLNFLKSREDSDQCPEFLFPVPFSSPVYHGKAESYLFLRPKVICF